MTPAQIEEGGRRLSRRLPAQPNVGREKADWERAAEVKISND
jgi:hypothetical protein